jgi:hypothetical protein
MPSDIELLRLKAKAKAKAESQRQQLSTTPTVIGKEPGAIFAPAGEKQMEKLAGLSQVVQGTPSTGQAVGAGMVKGLERFTGFGGDVMQAVAPELHKKISAIQGMSEMTHPKAYKRAELGTDVGAQLAADVIVGAPTDIAGKTIRGGLAGAAYGAAEPAESPTERLRNIYMHGTMGAGTSALMHPIGMGLTAGGKRILRTTPGRVVSARSKKIFDYLAKKAGRHAEEKAMLATHPTKEVLGRLKKLPMKNKTAIREAGEIVGDAKQREIGRVMLDEGILDGKKLRGTLNNPKGMKLKTIERLNFWNKKKDALKSQYGEMPLFNAEKLASEIEESIGEELLQNQDDKLALKFYKQLESQVKALRGMPTDADGFITWNQAEDKLKKWGSFMFDNKGVLKKNMEGNNEVRLALKNAIESTLDEGTFGQDVALANKKLHNLIFIDELVDEYYQRGKMPGTGIEKVMGATGLGVMGYMGYAGSNPALVGVATTAVGLNAFRRRYGSQASAKFWNKLSQDLRKVGDTSFHQIIRSKADNPRSAILAHKLLYQKNKKYREFIKGVNNVAETEPESDKQKEPYDKIK